MVASAVVAGRNRDGSEDADDGAHEKWNVTPNVRANRPAEASSVSLVRDDAPCASDQAYAACRSGSG
jgi:hypothetical protein